MIVMQVANITVPETDVTSKDYAALKEQLQGALSTDQLLTVVGGYQKSLGVEINSQLLTRLASESGQ